MQEDIPLLDIELRIFLSITKVVGRVNDTLQTPVDAVRKAVVLIYAANQLAPIAKPRGFVFKAKSYELYEAWKRNQTNPRLW